ncbi:MAG: nitroreductase family protein [Anaerolineales bacterium]
MDLFDAIHTRHSVSKVKADALPREWVEKILEAGNAAPNHHKVRPWRFFALSGDALKKLGDAMAQSQHERFPEIQPDGLEKTRALPLRAPLIIAVGVDQPAEPKIIELENYAAAAAACQNILLAAHALGLGAIWRTGEWSRDARVKEFLGLQPDQHLVGLIYIGYPEAESAAAPRPSFADRTTWM